MRLHRNAVPPRQGFSLIEAMTAVALVTVSCSAMLLSVSQAMQASVASQGTSRANMLAQELMTEISACRWADPKEPNHWGPESDETRTKTRAAFDDIDDYDGWSGPPQTRDGIDYDSWQRKLFPSVTSHEYREYICSVSVQFVSSYGQVVSAEKPSLYRQVTVEVKHPKHAPQKLSQIFYDPAPLLGRTHWLDPKVKEPVAKVTIVPWVDPDIKKTAAKVTEAP